MTKSREIPLKCSKIDPALIAMMARTHYGERSTHRRAKKTGGLQNAEDPKSAS
jgi:hypothetical protein